MPKIIATVSPTIASTASGITTASTTGRFVSAAAPIAIIPAATTHQYQTGTSTALITCSCRLPMSWSARAASVLSGGPAICDGRSVMIGTFPSETTCLIGKLSRCFPVRQVFSCGVHLSDRARRLQHPRVFKLGDLGLGQPGLGEHLARVLAGKRGRPADRRRSGGEPRGRRDDLVGPGGRMLGLGQAVDHLVQAPGRRGSYLVA